MWLQVEERKETLAGIDLDCGLLPRRERNALWVRLESLTVSLIRLESLTVSLVRLESLTYFLAGVIYAQVCPIYHE